MGFPPEIKSDYTPLPSDELVERESLEASLTYLDYLKKGQEPDPELLATARTLYARFKSKGWTIKLSKKTAGYF